MSLLALRFGDVMQQRALLFEDLLRAVKTRDPDLAELIIRFLNQPDPPEDRPEDAPLADDGGEGSWPALPEGSWTLDRARGELANHKMAERTPTERKVARLEAYAGLEGAPYAPPRLRIASLLIELYQQNDEWARAALIEIFRRCPLIWGSWKAFKTIYKLAESNHDATMFGLLAWRLDATRSPDHAVDHQGRRHPEVAKQTLVYMRRRAWRYLRQLGQSVPEIYPQFAAQALRHYPAGFNFSGSWLAHQIWAHEEMKGMTSGLYANRAPKDLKKRAFNDAWKLSAEPLWRLLEDAQNDVVCDFCVRSLKKDFPDQLKTVDVAVLARLGAKKTPSAHELVIEIFSSRPELHPSKLEEAGLHDVVMGFLLSDSAKARKYAIEYATAHGPSLDIDTLATLVFEARRFKEVVEFAASHLAQRTPEAIGLARLIRLLTVSATEKLAAEKIKQGFAPQDITAELFIVVMTSGASGAKKFIADYYKEQKEKIPAAYYCALLDRPDLDYYTGADALRVLGKRKGDEIGIEWLKKSLFDQRYRNDVQRWLLGGKLKGDALDVEWVKGLVMRPQLRAFALQLLGKRDLVDPMRVGLSWLLAMARQADEALNQFAHRYLLEHFSPEDFARAAGGAAGVEAGVAKLWSLASGADEPESVRLFAGAYLRLHHPQLGPTMPEAKSYGIKPRLLREHYGLSRVRELFFDPRVDVRRLAAAIARYELVAWDDKALVYQLADGRYREGRAVAADALMGIGEPDADSKLVPAADWLDPASIFALSESSTKATREVALTLIRRHYAALGGAQKLAWLMESPDREVGLFAVRLLWEKHRPIALPDSWRPQKGRFEPRDADAERFETNAALKLFLRSVMFGLPPGRMERRELAAGAGQSLPDRPLSASVAKRRLVAAVRAFAEQDAGFAALVVDVLAEFATSQAKGEWQACVTALARIRNAHPSLDVVIPGTASS
jgi:hypothetical protein